MRNVSLFFATMFFSGLLHKLNSRLFPPAGGTYGSIITTIIIGFIYYITVGEKTSISIAISIGIISLTLAIALLSIPGSILSLTYLHILDSQDKESLDKKASSGDFNAINIDEAHGVAVASFPVFCLMPENWISFLALSFVLFRIFDITKCLGIGSFEEWMSSKVETTYGKALAITLDDTLAGIYAAILTWAAIAIWTASQTAS